MDFHEAYTDTCSSVGIAARLGKLNALKKLLSEGRPVDVKDNRGWMPLHEAAYNGHTDCIDLLLKQDETDVNWKTFEGETALLLACQKGHSGSVRRLLDAGADKDLPTNEDVTPLFEACNGKNLGCVKLLLEAGCTVNQQVYTGDTALHIAVERGCTEIVKLLLQHDADICAVTPHNLTPVFIASQYGHADCLRLLLDEATRQGKDVVNMTASDNASPLLIACHNGHDECVKILLASGADPTLKVTLDGEDLTLDALQYAVKFGHDRCLRLLLNGSRLTPHEYSPQEFHPLRLAIRHEDVSCLRILIDSGFRLDQTFYDVDEELDNRYGSLLCFSPTYKTAQLVIQAGFDFSTWKPDHNIQSGNVKEYDPVTESLENTKVLDLLLSNGAKIGGAETFWLEVMRYIYFNFGFYLGDNEIDLTCKKLNPIFVFIKNGCDVKECLCQIFSLVTSDDFEQLVGNFLDVILKSLFFYPMILLSVNFEVPDKLLSKLKQSQKGVGPDHIDFLKKIQEESYTLRHACRVAVARHMISLDRWDSDRIERLLLPRILLDYLQYKEFGCYGEEFINGFSILRRCLDSPKGSKG